MLDFFKKKNKPVQEQTSDFLNVENSAFNTSAESQTVVDTTDYQNLVYQEPVYDVPKYKAVRNGNVDIVIDSNQLGFDKNTFNPSIKTVELPNEEEQSTMPVDDIVIDSNANDNAEIIDSVEILDSLISDIQPVSTINNDMKLSDKASIFKDMPIEYLKADENKELEKDEEGSKFSIFGSKDGVSNLNSYSSNNQYQEEKKELESNVEYTKDGYKICPKCGAILNPSAPVCFMCSKSFILKK